MIRLRAALFTFLLVLAASLSAGPAYADGEKAKEPLQKVGEGMKRLGKKVGEAGKEAGREVAEAARKVWYKGKQVSKPLLESTQRATREFWQDLLRGKEKTIAELREENRRLRRKLEEVE
jgi:hypothetical protein